MTDAQAAEIIARELALDRPLVSFDLETTGVNKREDRIVSMHVVKVMPDGGHHEWETLVDPGIPIPAAATEVHGISDADVAGAPSFKSIAANVAKGFEGCDAAGYNAARFDLELLGAEMARVGVPFDWERITVVDSFAIYAKLMPRNLTACVKTLFGDEAAESFKEHAHGAAADNLWSLRCLARFLEAFPEIPRTAREVHDWTFPRDPSWVDARGKVAFNAGGEACLTFGKYAGQTIRHVRDADLRYLGFMVGPKADGVSAEVKKILREAIAGAFPQRGA